MYKRIILTSALFVVVFSSVIANPPKWELIGNTQFSMVLMAKVSLNGEEFKSNNGKNMLGAFGPGGTNDCRSIAKWEAHPKQGWFFWYLTIIGNIEGEPIRFKIYDACTDAVYDCNEMKEFVKDATYGTPPEPFELTSYGISPGKIEGVISLSDGNGKVENVKILIADYIIHPDSKGYYSIDISPNVYNMAVFLSGYKTQTKDEIKVSEGLTTRKVNFTLKSLK